MLLRKPRAADAPLMFSAYAQDPAVTRYLTCAHMQTSPKRVRLLIASWRPGKSRRSFAGCFSRTTPDSCLDRSGRGQRMVDSISAFFSHVLTGGAVTCRKRSP